jgi:hypothetical protein
MEYTYYLKPRVQSRADGLSFVPPAIYLPCHPCRSALAITRAHPSALPIPVLYWTRWYGYGTLDVGEVSIEIASGSQSTCELDDVELHPVHWR